MKKGKIAFVLSLLILVGLFNAWPTTFAFTPPVGWNSHVEITLTETAGFDRVDEPVDVLFEPAFGTCQNVSEIRVIASNEVTEIPSQVYDVVTSGGFITSCRVVFLADCPASSSVKYYIIYNNPSPTTPVYDGLRLHTIAEGDTYNVTALVGATEKNYAHIWWKQSAELYSNGKLVCWSGGGQGLYNQINWASLWSGLRWDGAEDTQGMIFGWNKSLSVLNSGPVFVDFNYTEAGGTPQFLAPEYVTLFNYNVTQTSINRIYYQPNLNPLVRFHKTFKIKTSLDNYTVGGPAYLDFRLANSSETGVNHMAYEYFTWKNTTGHTNTVQTPTYVSTRIWSTTSPVGWWSFSGPRSESLYWPAAEIGYVPIQVGGTISGANYSIRAIESLDKDDNKCGQWFDDSYNGTNGDTFEIVSYIVTPHITGDVNLDWIVDIGDIVIVAIAFGSTPGTPTWNPNADVNLPWDEVDIGDIVFVAIHFGEEDTRTEEQRMDDTASQLRSPLEVS